MARSTGPKPVQCYLCGHRFEVGAMAQSTSCPGCHKPVIVADEIVANGKRRGPIRELRTCGKIVVGKRARLICEHLEAHGGIESQGIIDAKDIICGGTLKLGPKSEFKGHLHAHDVVMESGAKVKPSMFHVPSDPRGLRAEVGVDPRKDKKK
ncbi:MAG: polymer-forming cytoskeletal protein [Planctomycetota bacterium]